MGGTEVVVGAGGGGAPGGGDLTTGPRQRRAMTWGMLSKGLGTL